MSSDNLETTGDESGVLPWWWRVRNSLHLCRWTVVPERSNSWAGQPSSVHLVCCSCDDRRRTSILHDALLYWVWSGAHQMEPPSPLISWVNPFPSRFINRTACFPWKVSYFRESRMSDLYHHESCLMKLALEKLNRRQQLLDREANSKVIC